MKLKIVFFIICWGLLSLLHLQAENVAVFEEFGQPGGIFIGNDFIYIQEKTTIYIYKLKDYQFFKKFGKEGEGPGELKINPFGGPMGIFPYKGKLYVSSFGKLTIFSKSGEYIEEHKISPFDSYSPYAGNYICFSSMPKEENSPKIVLALFLSDQSLKKGKLIYKSDIEVGPKARFNLPFTPFYPGIDGDTLFVVAGIHGFAIDAFNPKGEKMYRIKKDYNQLKLPSAYKDKTMKWFRTAPNYKQFFDFFKTRMTFKDYYPPIFLMLVDNGHLYVLTNKVNKEQKRECIIMDLKGNEKKRVYLPVPENYGMDFEFHFTISNNYFYKLEENIDEETWELIRVKI